MGSKEMIHKNRFISHLYILLTAILLLSAIVASTSKALLAFYAAVTMPLINIGHDKAIQAQMNGIKRQIQNHFSEYNVFIAMEDITETISDVKSQDQFRQMLVKVCGTGQVLVMVPLHFKFPLIGDRILEWCWKPKIKKTVISKTDSQLFHESRSPELL